ncbi:iron(III) transport system substrate-binding protein [Austwickia chelonae]|uniref:Putative ABC transporter substrate-binding protein n=1 Tax=Austwickia chelonae NBRC 105200 TaxID=1184607 RepID=K6VP27_9MICO|nr:ABC transporter substrate-binding protein [Austwickia chelonae]GAB77115.1 putative ABC transporter substrate-binding protein [Austwickia chelonae NBRC 105200]SEW03110.1 iron(III) transport system substrate-binding protein [Austwickia chelonae]
MTRTARVAATVTAGCLIGLAVTSCAVDEKTLASASGGGSGTISVACGAMEDVCAAWTKAFTAKTGVPATFVRLSSGETVARLAAAKTAPEFDVWHGGPADGYGAAREQGLLEKYAPPTAAKIPEKYKDPEGYWHGVYLGALGFCSNKKVLESLGQPVPQSWEDLLSPKLKKQISTAHPSTSGTAFTTLWTQVVRLGGEDAGLDYMKKLHSNVLQYTKSGTAPGQAAGRGEAAVGLVFSHDCVLYKEKGMSDLVVSFPKEGTGYEVGGVAVVKGSKNADAAKKYAEWALTAEAQDIGPTVGSYQVHTNPESKEDPRMVKLSDVNLIDYDFTKAAKAKKPLTQRFDADVAAQPKS